MEATQVISDSFLESDESENEDEDENKRGPPLAKLCILKNELVPETELPLFLGNNVLGRDLSACTLHLPAPSISKQHATISLSVYSRRGRRSEGDVEALVWDLGSMNGTRKGRLKLTPNVRYALSDGDSLVVADIPCQYVSCTVDAKSSQEGMRTPVSRNMVVKAGSLYVTEKEGGDKSTDSKKFENRDTKARVSSTKTPVRAGCLFLEQTPTQPEGTLVPESDADSDGEREGGGRGRMALVSDSDSHKSSPACSTFLSPTNKVVPESEDESPITPSSSSKNRPYRNVRFSKEETEEDVAGQRLEEKKTHAIVDDSEEEEGREKETVTPEETKSKESGPHVPVTQGGNVSFMGDDELPVSTSAVTKDVILLLNMDSDTDVEGEEEEVSSAGPVTLNINQVSQPPNTAHFHMDSDTDEDEDALDKDLKAGTSSDDSTKLSHVNSAIEPEGITLDSDTDVDDDAALSDADTKTNPISVQSASTADTAPSMQPKDFHLDSDTDIDDEDERECATNESSSKIDEISIKLETKPAGPESAAAAPHGLHFESDTDDEEIPAPTLNEPPVVSAGATDSRTAADRGVAILSDSDTDMEDDSPQVMSVAVTTLSASPGTKPAALESDSDADTDVEGSGPGGSKPTDLGLDSDTDVEDKEADIDEAGDDHLPNLSRENTPGLMVPLLQNCSTPVQLPEGEVEKMDTQAFVSPSSVPFRGAVAAAVRPVALSSCSDSQEEEDYFVAETQSFILQNRDFHSRRPEDHAMEPTQAFCPETSGDETDQPSCRERSFQLGLSGSIHRQCTAQALAMENTQAFVERGVNMEDTQAYATTSTADRTSADNDAILEATQDYEEDEEPPRYPEKEGPTVLVLEETQAYITKPDSDSESETDEDERKNITATAETQPFGFTTPCTPTMAEIQPISAFEEEESVAEESQERGGTLQPQQRMSGEVLSIAQTHKLERGVNMEDTQAYATTSTADRTSADNDAILEATQDYEEDEEPARYPEKEGPTVLVLEETQAYITKPDSDSESETDEDERKNITATAETQPFGFTTPCTPTMAETQPISAFEEEESVAEESEERRGTLQPQQRMSGEVLSIAQTQPMNTCSNGESDDEEEEQTQPLTGSDLSVAETQPMHIVCAETQPMVTSDEEDLMPGPRKRKEKQLSEESLTQTLTNSEVSAAETQPVDPVEGGDSDVDDSIPVFKRRRAKPLQLSQTQSLSGSEAFAAETQPMATSDDEDLMPRQRKRRAKQLSEEELTQTLTNSEVSTVETQPVDPVEGGESDEEDSIPVFKRRRAKPLPLEATQSLSGSEAFAAETQPMGAHEGEQSDKEDSVPGPRKSKAKQLRLEEVETQPLSVGTQPMETGEDKESKDGDSIPGPGKRKAKALQLEEEETQPLTSSEVAAVESQVTQSEAGTSGIIVRDKRRTRATKREEEEQTECSGSPKRQTRGKSKALPTIKGRRGKSGPVGDVSEEEEDLEQGRRTRGRTFTRQQKGNEEDGGKSEFERNKPAENGNRIKKKTKALGEERGVVDLRNTEREKRENEEIVRHRMEEQERLHVENMERIQLEQETAEKERKEQEKKERVEKEKKKLEDRETAARIQKEKEQLEKKKRDNDEIERLEREKAECEEREKLERERKEQEEKERLEKEKRELEERLETESREEEHQARLQREERVRLEKEKETKEKPIKEQQENKSKVSIGGRRAMKNTTVAACLTEQDSAVLAEDDVPARRTRSRSNSSNSISSERSVSSINTQQGRGRGRGRGARRTSEPPKTAVVRRGNRRRTVAAETTEQDNNDGVLSRSNSSNSLNSDISSYSVSSQSRGGRGGRQRGRPQITEAEPDSIPPINSQSDRNSATKPAARGRKGRKTEPSSSAVPQEDDAEKADSQQAPTTRGQRRATTNISESSAADEEKQSNQDEGHGSEESRPPKRNVLGRAQKSGASAASNGDEAKNKRQGRKRELEPNIEEESHSSTNISIVKVQAVETTQEGRKDESQDENPVQAKRRGRALNAQVKKDTNASPVEVELKIEKENVEKKGRSRPSAVQKKREEEQEESGTSANSTTREAKVQTPETPTSRVSRKRQAPADSSPVAKTPRSSSSSSPAARGRLQAASPAYKVLFTGVTDEAWERVLARLGGSVAKGVADMDCLVTDQVRRTIKFLCAVAKGIPIVTTCWLEKSGKAGSFLSPHAFVVKDPEQEKKFGFCLQTSLTIARSHLLLQGYEIHVTKSVKPEPAQMKDIISCSGATFLPKMPSSPKPRTVVISCEEDWSLCGPAVSSSLPVVTAEFILSGILQQKVDIQTHALPAPVINAGGRRRGRNKT
ncbi:mediator of DNA damage checkpoint protein 1 isoform X2 [Platichthys flesus]|uniref:mediator of DNA damage checkpoint protein 1 isoform X2 n=1 Tax=Platichthys flesus TaxID=8260 RepID=UPI002DBCDBCD|nr:mediator of DNA damage checkpoint protein 1 isoform X2 [Platichthys flesus]